jgi:EamA domain-containing membrane protein RarD
MKSFTKDISHYFVLFAILLATFAGLILFSYDKNFQVAISLALALSYVSWGVVHHHLHNDLHLETFLEYLVIAFLGFVIIFSVIVRT